MYIKKRDGREVPFDSTKITNAVLKAFKEVDGSVSDYAIEKAEHIAAYVEKQCLSEPDELTVEQIQDLVEKGLMATKRKDVAKAYILYRDKRTRARDYNSEFMQEVTEKLGATNVQNQNANVDEHSFGGRMGEANRALMKKYALDNCMSDMARENHLANEIYIHDLDSYAVGMHNCLTIPFDKLLAEGFNTKQMDIRPAGSVNSAFQLVAVIFQLQSLQQFGGVSASHLDWTMVAYVRKSFRKHFIDGLKYVDGSNDFNDIPKDASIESVEYKSQPKAYKYAMDMTEREVHQAVESMYHNLKY